jgi:hypothetical protein
VGEAYIGVRPTLLSGVSAFGANTRSRSRRHPDRSLASFAQEVSDRGPWVSLKSVLDVAIVDVVDYAVLR